MRTIIAVTILAVALLLAIFLVAANWRKAASDIQLSIASTNNVAAIGSMITLTERIRNRSKETIRVNQNTPNSYIISNQSGKTYYLLPYHNPYEVETYSPKLWPKVVGAEESVEWQMRLSIGKDVEAGNYELKDVRAITIESNRVYSLVSNLIDVKVVK